jgi:polyisoprenoid-binding protein YceI
MNRKVLTRVLLAVGALVLLVIGGVVFYVQVIEGDAPDPLEFSDSDSTDDTSDGTGSTDDTTAPLDDVDGVWTIGADTVVGYRVVEDFLGGIQDNEAVGRTSDVTGSLTIDGTTVPDATFTADLTGLESDEPQRDGRVQDNILQTAEFPEATFTLTAPIDFGAVPAADETVSAEATGELDLHGVTQEVTFEVEARIVDDHIEVLGEIPIVFADYGIDNPSNSFVTTEDNGLLEFLLFLEPAA